MKISNRYFQLIILGIIFVTVIICTLLVVWPQDFKPENSSDEIKNEMIFRSKTISESRDSLCMISITPFMWDEGYIVDNSYNKRDLNQLLGNRVEFNNLDDGEQRLIFFYEGQNVVDLIVNQDEIYFDFETGIISDKWLSIDIFESEVIRIFE